MAAVEYTDAELVSRSRAGDRDAFSRIVTRYQVLICSLAYNRLGNLGQSEDVAQETFITAWKHLGLLREPEKLRSWLCGIVRNRLHKHLDRETREPASQTGSIEIIEDAAGGEVSPSEETIGREEEAILWRSLEKIPELYREPLILFYRENQSVGEVAAALELTEDTVKQRLSRGRKLLQEEVQVFVEKTLRRSAPSRTFSSAVLAALPVAPTATVGVGTMGKGAAATKSGLLGLWLAPLAPFIGVLAGLFSQLFIIRATTIGRERRNKSIRITVFFVLLAGVAVGGEYAVEAAARHWGWTDPVYFLVRTIFWWLFGAGLATWVIGQLRKAEAVYAQKSQEGVASSGRMNLSPLAQGFMVVSTEFAMFLWLISVAYRAHDPATAGVLAGLMVALGIWNFIGSRRRDGAAVALAMASHMAIYGIIVLLVFNLRLDVWMATARGVSLDEIHTLFSPWIVPSLSAALVAWVSIVWMLSKPRSQSDE